MNLTDSQKQLLRELVGLQLSGGVNDAFEVVRSHAGTYVRYPGRSSGDVAADMLDFQALESEGLITLSHSRIGVPRGKVTQKGIEIIRVQLGMPQWQGHPAGRSGARKQFADMLEARQTGTSPIKPTAPPPVQPAIRPTAPPPVQRPTLQVFIGHGRTYDWMVLKDFLEKELKLEITEFSSVPVAGVTTPERLQEMLDSARFAFLVMTGEDQHADGSIHARENVIHEIGLFQGKLGLKKAIVLIEEGCEDFSNLAGVNTIRFAKRQIDATFEKVRRTLRREGIIS